MSQFYHVPLPADHEVYANASTFPQSIQQQLPSNSEKNANTPSGSTSFIPAEDYNNAQLVPTHRAWPNPGTLTYSPAASSPLPLPHASGAIQQRVSFTQSPQPAAVPVLRTAPRRVRVPQTIRASQSSRPFYSVEFKTRGSAGVRVQDILKGRASLDSREDPVFESTGVRQFRLVISWPGYPHSGTYIPVQNSNGFITRSRLAMLICMHISRFVDTIIKKRDAHGTGRWIINRRGILLDNLWLLSVAPAKHNIWVAEIEAQI